jgi:hypothetical protein
MPNEFSFFLQNLVLKHPYLSPIEIVGRLFGEDRISSKSKLLYRQLNPYDNGAHFDLNNLPRLIEILNEKLSDEEKETKGGNAIIHFLCKKSGMVATQSLDEKKTEAVKLSEPVKKLGNFLSTLVVANGLTPTSAATLILDDGYEAQASLSKLISLATISKKTH